jgi:glutamate synthase domain-containing protein 2
MSFGSLSPRAIEAINRGVKLAGALQNTGEGGISDYHRSGGDLIWQLGTGYFGCRDERGRFSMERLRETVASAPVRALEIKLSQGAKPGLGGVLPAAKVTAEIAKIRLIPLGHDCISPSAHTAFHDVDSMLDFIEQLAEGSEERAKQIAASLTSAISSICSLASYACSAAHASASHAASVQPCSHDQRHDAYDTIAGRRAR